MPSGPRVVERTRQAPPGAMSWEYCSSLLKAQVEEQRRRRDTICGLARRRCDGGARRRTRPRGSGRRGGHAHAGGQTFLRAAAGRAHGSRGCRCRRLAACSRHAGGAPRAGPRRRAPACCPDRGVVVEADRARRTAGDRVGPRALVVAHARRCARSGDDPHRRPGGGPDWMVCRWSDTPAAGSCRR